MRTCALVLALGMAMPALASETASYTYDARGRLVRVCHSGSVNNGIDTSYTYDKTDNRAAVTTATGGACGGGGGGGAPSFAISDASIGEGGTLGFTVTKTGSTSSSFSLDFATASGTATSGTDFTAASGTLTFTAAETSKPVNVATIQDSTVEANETVLVNLTNATGGATITDAQGVGTIVNDDSAAAVSFSVNDVEGTEGNTFVFTITKSGSASGSVSVDYATANDSAVGPGDYAPASGTLTFAASETTKTVSVPTNDDQFDEDIETFFLNLSNPTGGATIADGQGTGSIDDNDEPIEPCPTC